MHRRRPTRYTRVDVAYGAILQIIENYNLYRARGLKHQHVYCILAYCRAFGVEILCHLLCRQDKKGFSLVQLGSAIRLEDVA